MKLVLGAAQFGLPYGISNKHGQTTERQVREILKFASKMGISCIDTAASYGDSEKVLGNTLTNHDWKIITKSPSFKNESIGSDQRRKLRRSFARSMSNLGCQTLYGMLIHSCDDLFNPGGKTLFRELEELRLSGLVRKIGVAVYTGEQVDRLLGEFDIDLIQLPISIVDQRLLLGGHLHKLKEYDVEIHARSVFLQGLLLMPESSIPSFFFPIQTELGKFRDRAKQLSMTKLQLALGFVQSLEAVDRIVCGVSTVEQLRQILEAIDVEVNVADLSDLSILSPQYLNPTLWKI